MTLITPPPTAPNRADPATFPDRADAYVAWWATVAAEINGGALGATWVIGTVSEPSVRASTDENTGLNFLGGDQLQLVTGGSQRLLLTTSEALVNLPLRSSATADVSSSNALDSLSAGNHRVYVAAANVATVNGPSGASRGVVEQFYGNASYIAQLYSETNGTTPRQWYRIYDSGTWRAWRQIQNNATVVGTVAQTGGVPTDALFETGSNANGTYVRFADGTQMCWHSLTIVSGGTITWTYPSAFAGTVFYQATAQSTDDRTITGGSATTTSMALYGWTTVGATWNGTLRAFAIGRWY